MPGHNHSVPVDPPSMCRYDGQGFGADITLAESVRHVARKFWMN